MNMSQWIMILLVRHGKTALNHQGRYQGVTDAPLEVSAKNELRSLFRSLSKFLSQKGENLRQIYCSRLSRSVETAEIAKEIFCESGILQLKELDEISFGIFEGQEKKEVQRLFAVNFPELMNGPYLDFDAFYPDGGSLKEKVKELKNLFKKENKTVVDNSIIILHNGVFKALAVSILGVSYSQALTFDLSHGDIIVFDDTFKNKLTLEHL